jgi:hypothetical protein
VNDPAPDAPRRSPAGARLVALVALGVSGCLYSLNWWYTGPLYLIVHVVVVGGAVAMSRTFEDGPDAPGRILRIAALGLPLLGGSATSTTWATVDHALRETWPLWSPLVVLGVAALVARWRSVALLSARHAVATCAVVVSAPVVVVACLQAAGGAATFLVYPVVILVIARSASWVLGRRSPTANALRTAVPVLVLAVVAVASLDGLAGGGLFDAASIEHLGWALALLAVALHYARDPLTLAPAQPIPEQGPYR